MRSIVGHSISLSRVNPSSRSLLAHLEDPRLRHVEQLVRRRVPVVGLGDDAGRRLDQAAQDRLVLDDPRVVLEVGRGGNDVDQFGEVVVAADRLQFAAAVELVAQRDVVDDAAALGEATMARKRRRCASW